MEFPLDDVLNPLQRPAITAEAQGFGSALERPAQDFQLLVAQLGRTPAALSSPELAPPALSHSLGPAANRRARDTQLPCNFRFRPSLAAEHSTGLEPTFFHLLQCKASWFPYHAPIVNLF